MPYVHVYISRQRIYKNIRPQRLTGYLSTLFTNEHGRQADKQSQKEKERNTTMNVKSNTVTQTNIGLRQTSDTNLRAPPPKILRLRLSIEIC